MRAWRIGRFALAPLAVRHLAAHKRVAGVTGVAIATAVAAIVATHLLYEGVVRSYETTTLRFAGRAALQVTNGESGVSEEIADELRRIPGVRAVVASVEGFVAAPDLPGERLYLYGVDLLADQEVRDYGTTATAVVSDPLVFLAAPDSVALSRAFVKGHGLKMHQRIRLLAPAGVVELTIRAVLGAEQGPASVFDGRVAVLDLSVAQSLLRLEGRVSELAIEIEPGIPLEGLERAVAERVGGRGAVERPKSRAAAFARLLRNYRYGLLLAATTATIVALYFVYALATIAVLERRRELGLLRAVGLSTAGVATLVVGELLMLSVAAASLGVPFGLALARVLASAVGSTVSALYAEVGAPTPELRFGVVLLAVGLGTLTALCAALGPLTQVLLLRPLESLRFPGTAGGNRVSAFHAAAGGLATMTIASAAWIGRGALPVATETLGMVAMLGAIIGVALVVPLAVRLLCALTERVARPRAGALAMLASRNVASDIGSVAVTCSAVLVGLAGTIAICTWLASLEATLDTAFDSVFGTVDLLVSAGAEPFAPEATRIPGPLAEAIAAVPGVAHVDPIRINTIAFEGSLAAVNAADAEAYVRGRRALYMVDGDRTEAARALAAGSAVVVNQAFASRFGRRRGDELTLVTPEGPLRVRIVGIHLELAPGDLATIHLDRTLYRRWWRDDTISLLALSLRTRGDRSSVVAAIRSRWGAQHRLVVFTLEQLRREYRAMLRRLSRLVFPLLGCAVIVALVGVVSARVTSLLQRSRVSSLFRAIGATRHQLTLVFMIEGIIIGGIAAFLAALAGAVLGHIQVDVLMRGMMGMSIVYSYPRAVAGAGGMGVVMLTGAVGWLFGRRSAESVSGETLRWE